MPSSAILVSSKPKDPAAKALGVDKVAAAAVDAKTVLLNQKLRGLTIDAVRLEAKARTQRIKAAKLTRQAQQTARVANKRTTTLYTADLKLAEHSIRLNATQNERATKGSMKLEFANQELKDVSLREATKATIRDQKLLKRQTAVAQAAAVAEMTANKSAAKKLIGTVGRQVAQDKSIALQAQVSSLDKEMSQVKGEQSKFESLEVETKKSHEIKMRNQQKEYAHKLQEIEDQSIVHSANAKIAEEQRLGFIQKNLEVQEKMKEQQANVVRTQDSLATTLTQQTELRKAEEAAATERDKLKSFNREMQRMSRVKETYRFGEMSTTKCQAGDVKITDDKECRAATSALLPDGKYNGSRSKSNEPGGCFAGTSGNGNLNSNMAGKAAQGRRPICKSASERDIQAEVADIKLKSSIALATARASAAKATVSLIATISE